MKRGSHEAYNLQRRRRRTQTLQGVSISQHQGREHQRAEPENESLAGAADTLRASGEQRLGPFKINFEFKVLNVFSRHKDGILQLGLAYPAAGFASLLKQQSTDSICWLL